MRRSQCRLARERLGEVAPQFCDRRGGLRGLELGARGPKRVPPHRLRLATILARVVFPRLPLDVVSHVVAFGCHAGDY